MRSSRKSFGPRVLFVWTALAAGAIAAPAYATPNFPGVVASHLQLDAPPPCTLCHSGTPGRGTVTTPFGTTLRKRGLTAYDEASLGNALDAIDAENKDSDGDGVPDVKELRAGEDPNVGAGGATSELVPEYGCAVGRELRGGRGAPSAWLLALLVFALRTRQRRRAREDVSRTASG